MSPQLDTPVFELSLGDYTAYGASIRCSPDGATFAVTIGPVADTTVAALDAVARNHGRICLYCRNEPLLVELVAVERNGPLKTRIEGRIVGDVSYAKVKSA